MFSDSFKRSIVNHLIAKAEGRKVRDPLEPYFRAFAGAFEPDMPFTFYFEAKNKPLLLVYDPTPVPARSSRAAFAGRCERIKERILPVAGCVRKLVDSGYVTETPLDFKDRPLPPPDYEQRWRAYRHFYSDVADGLSFLCFTRLAPARKLYDLLAAAGPRALAG